MRTLRKATLLVLSMLCFCGCYQSVEKGASSRTVDLGRAVIVFSPSNPRHAKAVQMLQEEIEKRTGIRLARSESMPGEDRPAIVLGTVESLSGSYSPPEGLSVPQKAEGYAMWVDVKMRNAPTVYLVGHDDRGALFAAGRLIRLANMGCETIRISGDLRLADAPAYPLRGHMLIRGQRFIGWDEAGYEQLIRDMVIFGTNSFELNKYYGFVAEILDSYGLDLWVFFGHGNVVDMKTLRDVEERFGHLEGLDHVFIPLGDSSRTPATRVMIPAAEHFAPLLKRVHPEAKIWLSHQNQRNHAENDNEYLFGYIRGVRPKWLEGMVYGPWAHWDIPGLRQRTPGQYRIRHYPDICHNQRCQYQVPKWGRAMCRTWGRNGISVMPRMMARIHNVTGPLSEGFVAYNHTGCSNDLNKFIWSAMGWDPNSDVNQVLREYGKVFFSDELADDVAQGLLMLEDNWRGPVAENEGIERALSHWQDIARRYGDVSKNWRLELFLYKAFIDAYVKRKYDIEARCEAEAYDALKQAGRIGVERAVSAARAALAGVEEEFPPRRKLEEELRSWGLSKYADLYKILGNLYSALNDRQWLEAEFEEILAMADEAAQLARIDRIVSWENPGPGGFYDNLGVEGRQPHLVRQKQWKDDPGYVHSPIEFNHHRPQSTYRQSWFTCALTRYDTPLLMRYERLDPQAKYRLRATYSGPFKPVMRLVADGKYEVHGPVGPPEPMRPLEFDVPQEATVDGVLDLEWKLTNLVRGCQVAEVWLLKRQ
ncbi:MAG: alpha-glucuronidase family glycosyl hydrolase [Planctomycetota bacterium]